MVKNHCNNYKIHVSRSGFGSSPKSNQFVLVTHRTCPPNFIWIRSQLSPHHTMSTIYHFWPYLSMAKNHLKIPVVRSGSSPKSNQFVLVTHRTCPPNFIRICTQLFEISCTQTNKQTNQRSFGNKRILAKKNTKNYHGRNLDPLRPDRAEIWSIVR